MFRRALRYLVFPAALGLLLGPAASAADAFSFTGRGWGHGLGMAQWGSKGLAEKGWDADRILRHYYSSTSVETRTLPGSIRVGLVQGASAVAVTVENGTANFAGSGGSQAAASGQVWRVESSGANAVVKRPDGSVAFESSTPVRITYAGSGRVRLSQANRYTRGVIDIEPVSGSLRAVITLGIDEYLYGLGEMPSGWHTEALKVQAVAGRTYAVEKTLRLGQNRSGCNCAVYSSTLDQAYIGYDKEVSSFDRWKAAVDATSSRVVVHNGQIIQAFYSSASGGHTESNENVWGGSPIPYLRGVCDPGDYNRNLNPHNNWEVTLSADQLGSKLSAAGHNVGVPQAVDYLAPKGASGRILSVKSATSGGVRVTGSTSVARISGTQLRSALGLKSTLIGPRIYGRIRERYDDFNCDPGTPVNEEYDFRYLNGTVKGRVQNFTQGNLTWDTREAYWTYGAILGKYNELRSGGFELGLPQTDELGVPGGRASYFEYARIYWSPTTSVRVVYGAILGKYLENGGPATWGLPLTDEIAVRNGRASYFQQARIYWSPTTSVRVVYGAILGKYLEKGGPDGFLGLPLTDEEPAAAGRLSKFQSGTIYWSVSTGARLTYGAILNKYLQLGGPGGSMGFPTSDEYDVAGGRASDFQHGRLKWNASTQEVIVENR